MKIQSHLSLDDIKTSRLVSKRFRDTGRIAMLDNSQLVIRQNNFSISSLSDFGIKHVTLMHVSIFEILFISNDINDCISFWDRIQSITIIDCELDDLFFGLACKFRKVERIEIDKGEIAGGSTCIRSRCYPYLIKEYDYCRNAPLKLTKLIINRCNFTNVESTDPKYLEFFEFAAKSLKYFHITSNNIDKKMSDIAWNKFVHLEYLKIFIVSTQNYQSEDALTTFINKILCQDRMNMTLNQLRELHISTTRSHVESTLVCDTGLDFSRMINLKVSTCILYGQSHLLICNFIYFRN